MCVMCSWLAVCVLTYYSALDNVAANVSPQNQCCFVAHQCCFVARHCCLWLTNVVLWLTIVVL